MLAALNNGLQLSDPFDTCVWVICACVFWGLMRFGEATMKTRTQFDGAKHAKRADVWFSLNTLRRPYVHIRLLTAKTAKPGKLQDVFITKQPGPLCTLEALRNLAVIVPAQDSNPLFLWRDKLGNVCPAIRNTVLGCVQTVLAAYGWGSMYGHLFCIGGALRFLAQGVNPKIIRLAGQWQLLAYKTYIHMFKQVVSHHMGGAQA
jgi:hypothetical protein